MLCGLWPTYEPNQQLEQEANSSDDTEAPAFYGDAFQSAEDDLDGFGQDNPNLSCNHNSDLDSKSELDDEDYGEDIEHMMAVLYTPPHTPADSTSLHNVTSCH